jgi:hypothetical protein
MPSSRYAEGTTVSIERSRAELEALLVRFGATGFLYGWSGQQGMIAFELRGRRCRFVVRPPTEEEMPALREAARKQRQASRDAEKLVDQEIRRRWRELVLLVKAKLVAVESGAASFEEEFLGYLVLPGNITVAERLLPDLDRAASTGRLPPLLPGPTQALEQEE